MSSFHSKMTSLIVVGIAVILSNLLSAQSQTTPAQSDQASRISILYAPAQNSAFQQLYDLLRARHALERIQEILSPLQVPEQLTIETTECGAVNSYYQRKNFKPTVTICYEFLKHILDSVPNETTPAGDRTSRRDLPAAQFELAWSVIARTKSTIACFAGPSFHDANGAACVSCAWVTAGNSVRPSVGSKANPEIAARRLMFDFTFHLYGCKFWRRKITEPLDWGPPLQATETAAGASFCWPPADIAHSAKLTAAFLIDQQS